MKLDYNSLAGEYARHRQVHPKVLESLIEAGRLTPESQVLEVGCGTGNYTVALQELLPCSCRGIDPSEQMLGMIGAAFGLGFILVPLLGGLLGELGPRVPFLVAAGLALLNFCYGYFVLPESLAIEHRISFDWKRANPCGFFVAVEKISGSSRPGIITCIGLPGFSCRTKQLEFFQHRKILLES